MENDEKSIKPSFYEIAAKIIKFCEEADIAAKGHIADMGVNNDDDKRGL